MSEKKAAENSAIEISNMLDKRKISDMQGVEVVYEDDNDEDYVVEERKKKTRKIDVMGTVSNTGDRLGLSAREKAMFAAHVVKSVGVAVEETNISYSTASRKGREKRFETEKEIRVAFVTPDYVVIHWDGKILKLKAGKKGEFIAVYLSGENADKVTKLFGVPEVDSGSGEAQKEAVVEMLMKWNVFEEITGIVFDTTSSNTGQDIGACKLLEEYLEKAVLWLACRHHIYELHINHVVGVVTGTTTDLGVKLFRRLKSEWNSLTINYMELKKFDHSCSSSLLVKRAQVMLAWAEAHLSDGTWPRCDYKELLELVITWLGGSVPSFTLKYPGADHHARWLSKAIYYMKLALLIGQFPMDQKEQQEVLVIAEFVALFYAKGFFKSPLASAAPKTDLEFMSGILQYRVVQPKLAFICLQSCYKHLWYLTPRLVVFSLCDKDLEDAEREEVANTLFSKPVIPSIGLEDVPVPKLSSFLSEESWLLFDLQGIEAPQDWMQTPVKFWTSSQTTSSIRTMSPILVL